MRILFPIASLSGGGAERQLTYLATRLVALGHEVHIVYWFLGPDVGVLDQYARAGVVTHAIRRANKWDPRVLTQLFRVVRRVRPDVMQSCIPFSDVLAAVAAKFLGIPWVMREANAWSTVQCAADGLRRAVACWSRGIVANSQSGIEYWSNRYPAVPTCVIPNGFPVDEILNGRARSSAPAKQPMVGRRYLLFVGRLHPQKNIETLITAMRNVPSDVTLLVCGAGPLEEPCRARVRSLNLDQRVQFLGNVDKGAVWGLMRAAQALVLVSHYEGFPNVLVEAMLNRCPVVLSDIRPHRELVDETLACYVNKDDITDIARGIERVLSNSDNRAARVEGAFRLACTFTVERMADEYLALYERVTARTGTALARGRSIASEPHGTPHTHRPMARRQPRNG